MTQKFTHADAVRKLTVDRDLANQRAKAAEDDLKGAEAHVALLKASLKQSGAETEALRNLVDDITDMDFDDPEVALRTILDECRTAQKEWTYEAPTTLRTAAG
jgi:hypothetical protein